MKYDLPEELRRIPAPLPDPVTRPARPRFRRRAVLVASTRLPFTLTPAAHG